MLQNSSKLVADIRRPTWVKILNRYYQRDKAAGLIGPEDATFMLKNLIIKLNEIGYWYGVRFHYNSADLGQSITLGGFTEDGDDATAEMDYLILDAHRI